MIILLVVVVVALHFYVGYWCRKKESKHLHLFKDDKSW